jgi:type IV pilus assembly protein PilY1
MKKKTLIPLFLFLCLLTGPSFALDTDLYVLSGVNIPPNVLIILDSSASLDEVSSGQIYDPAIDYSLYLPPIVYPQNAVYYKASGNKWILWREHYDMISCSDLKNLLILYGEAINYPVDSGTSECGGNKKYDFQTGNFMNYLQLTGGPGGNRPRFGLATGIIHSYINTTQGVRFAVMAFNRDKNNNTVKWNGSSEYVYGDSRDDNLDADGGRLLGFVDETKTGKTALFNNLAVLKNDSWSPLAETLYEAGVYFQGGKSLITNTTYESPVQYHCQKNYILIISDGVATKDNHSALNSIGDLDGDGKIEADDVTKYLYNIDLSGGEYAIKQNISTYTIGFSLTHKLMEDTAKNGHGKYYYVWSSQSFNIAFQDFIAAVLEESVSYVAPVVPISQMEKTSSGNRMYLAMFKPTYSSFWNGNLKKYGIVTEKTETSNVGDILDVNGNLVMDSENQIKDDALSYWSAPCNPEKAGDGGEVECGGVGQILMNRTSARKIYTFLGTNYNLTDSSNAFSRLNGALTPSILGLPIGDNTGKDRLIDFIHGYDAYDENGNGILTEKRDWILGAFIHSRPLVIHYGTSQSVIYAGANDGMLHAFNDASGEELWAFIPPSLLPSLKNLNGEALEFFVDGSPKAYLGADQKIMIFGLRRGGNRYYALDITDPLVPRLLWEISPSTPGFGELGQTWSTPQIRKIQYGASEKWVAIVGGGYDSNQDNSPVTANDTRGRAVYIFDISNGSLLWSYSNTRDSNMRHSIPSDVSCVDTDGNGKIDRLYVGDMGGRVWRFDIGAQDTAGWTGKRIFNSNLVDTDQRKIFYPPDVTLENDEGNYEMVLFGTGDREHPNDATLINRLYAVKDKNPSTVLTENDLVDVTEDLLQDPATSEEQKTAILNQLAEKKGWYIRLDQNAGEKCLSNPLVFFGTVYYTTFTPSPERLNDICYVGGGEGRLYALKYKTGNAAFNLDLENDSSGQTLMRSDRSVIVGTAIPSGTIVAIIQGVATGYVGVGGGVYIPPLPSYKSIIPVHWRIVF